MGILALAIACAGLPFAAAAADGHPPHHHPVDAAGAEAMVLVSAAPAETLPADPAPPHAAGAMECCDMAVGDCIASPAQPPDHASALAVAGAEGVNPWNPRHKSGRVPDVDVPPPR